MERGRILILGNSKETTYEIRSLLDNQRFELEIALSPEVGKQVLSTRKMSLIMIHSEMLHEESLELFQFLRERGIDIPVMVLGEEATRFLKTNSFSPDIRCFEKPYVPSEVLSYIRAL